MRAIPLLLAIGCSSQIEGETLITEAWLEDAKLSCISSVAGACGTNATLVYRDIRGAIHSQTVALEGPIVGLNAGLGASPAQKISLDLPLSSVDRGMLFGDYQGWRLSAAPIAGISYATLRNRYGISMKDAAITFGAEVSAGHVWLDIYETVDTGL